MPRQAMIATLDRLVRRCRDAEELCRACSEAVRDATLRATLTKLSEDWARQADELQALVLLLSGIPSLAGTLRSRVTKLWLRAESALLGPDDLLVLNTSMHAQLRVLEAYEEALESDFPERIRHTVTEHARRIADRVEAIRGLRGKHAPLSQGR